MVLGLMTLLGGIPYLEKDDDLNATWTIYGTVEITWRGKRFGLGLNFKRTYNLRSLLGVSNKQIFNYFFEELNYHLKEAKERYYIERDYVVPPSLFEAANLPTINEVLTKSGLHHLMNTPNIGGKYEDPWIFKDVNIVKDVDIDCVRTITKHETAVSVEPIRNTDGCSD